MFQVDDAIPRGEFWCIVPGERTVVKFHEGPLAGQEREFWVRKPQFYRVVNVGESE